jgi:hypothetical protein
LGWNIAGLKWLNTKITGVGKGTAPQRLINKNTQILHLFADKQKNLDNHK